MDKEDSIEIKGKDNRIEVSNVEDIEVKGDHNVIRIDGEDRDIEIKGSKNIIEVREEEDIKKDFKTSIGKSFSFFKQKKVINILIIALFLIILISSVSIRTKNLPLLKDVTTGKYIPLALDPYYFLRIAETMVEGGGLPEYDTMRKPFDVEWSSEILPKTISWFWKIGKIFNKEITLRFINIISPVIFFALGLIAFFFLIYVLTSSKITALLSSAFLAFIPSYLYRTIAGFSDHESIGMFAFFLALFCYSISLIFLNKEKNSAKIKMIIPLALLVGFFSAFSIASWGGIASFLFMIIPVSFFIFWLMKDKKEEKNLLNLIWFYLIWIISTILFGMVFGFGASSIIKAFFLSTKGLISLFVPVFMIVDYLLIKNREKIKFIEKKYREIYSFCIAVILGLIFLIMKGENIFQMIGNIWASLLHPFGLGRVGLTVAENAQPYLLDWISQTGKTLFWFFYLGCIFVGIEISKGIKRKSNRIYFSILWILMISGILFSRISANSLFNGTNFISQAFYVIGLLLFVGYVVNIYFKKGIKISPELIIIATYIFFMLISGRSAIRFFFVLTPLVCFVASFFVIRLYNYYKNSKDDLLRLIFAIATIIVILLSLVSLIGFVNSISTQAKYIGPSANQHWQSAMSWVRENTPIGSIFVHWWDYGYWVQYLGKRPTIADGGHFQGAFRDHLIGRYLLTTPYPQTALSFMKANNVSYLLIDPTDIGKYPAYSSIGSDNNHDRYSGIIAMVNDPKQIQETSEGEIRIYQGSYGVDEDTLYEVNETEIFLPGPGYDKMNRPIFKSFIIGVVLEVIEEGNKVGFNQPKGVFVYNNNQYRVPLRYLYFEGQLFDFDLGIESGIRIMPSVIQGNNGVQIDRFGAGVYLSNRTFNSLVGQLYLLNDTLEEYEGVKIAHVEDSPIVKSLKAQGMDIREFVYFQGIQGPIKIWKINHREDIIAREEFLRKSGDWAEFDNLSFVK